MSLNQLGHFDASKCTDQAAAGQLGFIVATPQGAKAMFENTLPISFDERKQVLKSNNVKIVIQDCDEYQILQNSLHTSAV